MASTKAARPNTSFPELVDASRDALIALSFDGRILSWNSGAEALFGYTVQEAVGQAMAHLIVPEERRPEAGRVLAEAVEKGATHGETIRRRKDGTFVHVDVSMRR